MLAHQKLGCTFLNILTQSDARTKFKSHFGFPTMWNAIDASIHFSLFCAFGWYFENHLLHISILKLYSGETAHQTFDNTSSLLEFWSLRNANDKRYLKWDRVKFESLGRWKTYPQFESYTVAISTSCTTRLS